MPAVPLARDDVAAATTQDTMTFDTFNRNRRCWRQGKDWRWRPHA